jgi:hypothetical protein
MSVTISRSLRHVIPSLRASRQRGCGRRQRLGRRWPELTTRCARSNGCRVFLFRRCELGRPGGSLANYCSTRCTIERRLWRCCGRRVSQQKTSTLRIGLGTDIQSRRGQIMERFRLLVPSRSRLRANTAVVQKAIADSPESQSRHAVKNSLHNTTPPLVKILTEIPNHLRKFRPQ